MKRLAIAAAVVLLVCVGVCAWSMIALDGLLEEAHGMTVGVFTKMEDGDVPGAREELVALANLWAENAELLEMLCDHDDLHSVKERIIEARICMDYSDMEDFFSNISLVGEGIEHIREEESLRLSNLY